MPKNMVWYLKNRNQIFILKSKSWIVQKANFVVCLKIRMKGNFYHTQKDQLYHKWVIMPENKVHTHPFFCLISFWLWDFRPKSPPFSKKLNYYSILLSGWGVHPHPFFGLMGFLANWIIWIFENFNLINLMNLRI